MIHHRRKVRKKILLMIAAVALQFFLVYLYWLSQDFISNTTLSQLEKIYYPILKWEIRKVFDSKKSIINNSSSKPVDKIRAIPVLTYHGIVDREDGSNISMEEFLNQMFELKEAGYRTISLQEFSDFMNGRKEISGKPFLLTFDDGRKDSYYPVDPILNAFGWNAVIFVITGHFPERSNYYLSTRELKKMVFSGRWDVQVHTKDGHDLWVIDSNGRKGHYYSNKLWKEDERIESDEEFDERVVSDLIGAKQDIEKTLGVDAFGFAYPFGDYGQESINYPESQHILLNTVKSLYKTSFTQVNFDKDFSYNYEGVDDFLFRRISVKPNWTAENLLHILTSGEEKALPFRDGFSDDSGWIRTSGDAELRLGELTVGSGSGTSGAVFLDGTRSWKNYAFSANINWKRGSNVLLLARYRDENNHVSCNFSNAGVRIESKVNGKTKVLDEAHRNLNGLHENLNLGIKVDDEVVQCLVGNQPLLGNTHLEGLDSGGIGFEVWDSTIGNSKIAVREVSAGADWSDFPEGVKSDPGAKKDIPYNNHDLNQDSGWLQRWGNVSFENSDMILHATNESTGSLAVLSGAESWEDYVFETTLLLEKGSNVVLLARYKDNNNYVAFNISRSYVRLEQTVNGKRDVLTEKNISGALKIGTESRIKIDVLGNIVSGSIDNKVVISSTLIGNDTDSGGIAIKSWDVLPNNSEVIIKNIYVQ